MAACNRSFLMDYFIVFLCLFLFSIPRVVLGRELANRVKPEVLGQKIRMLNDRTAVFLIRSSPKSFVDVRLDGIKLLVRSLKGVSPVRIVLDHLAPGWHRVTFRLARPDQYEFGEEQVFRIHVPASTLGHQKNRLQRE